MFFLKKVPKGKIKWVMDQVQRVEDLSNRLFYWNESYDCGHFRMNELGVEFDKKDEVILFIALKECGLMFDVAILPEMKIIPDEGASCEEVFSDEMGDGDLQKLILDRVSSLKIEECLCEV